MDQKIVAVLVITLMFVAFLFVTPRGRQFREKYIDDRVGFLGNFFKNLTGKITNSDSSNKEKLSMAITTVPLSDLNGQTFDIKGSGFSGEMSYDYLAFAGGTVSLANSALEVSVPSMEGTVAFVSDKVQVSGKTDQLSVNELSFNTTKTDFVVVGSPTYFELNNIHADKLVFLDISGSLSWTGLKGIPPLLVEDNLELHDFDGYVTMNNGKITISGLVSKIRLNGVNIAV